MSASAMSDQSAAQRNPGLSTQNFPPARSVETSHSDDTWGLDRKISVKIDEETQA
jgi:hypothetical protein